MAAMLYYKGTTLGTIATRSLNGGRTDPLSARKARYGLLFRSVPDLQGIVSLDNTGILTYTVSMGKHNHPTQTVYLEGGPADGTYTAAEHGASALTYWGAGTASRYKATDRVHKDKGSRLKPVQVFEYSKGSEVPIRSLFTPPQEPKESQ